MVDDQFDSNSIPPHWSLYDGPYGTNTHNCAAPTQDVASGGYLHILMSYLPSGKCGAAWYTGGMRLDGFSAIDQRVTARFRIADSGVSAHYAIPMRWPDDDASWPAGGEEDYCESNVPSVCSSHLHYGATNEQVSHAYSVDLTQWHTLSFTRLNHVVTATIDGTVAWTYTGSSTTLPDTLKHVVLQHECQVTGCPTGTTGSSEIQIDWLTVENQSSPQPPEGVVPRLDHVFVVVEENHDYSQIIGSTEAPYLNFLAGEGASATDYHAVARPSLPDYLALIGGDTFGVTTDCSPADIGCSFATANLADRLEAAGLTWRGYFEGMPTPCRTTSSGGYRVHHDPFVYFDDIRNDSARCASGVRPLGDLATDLATPSGTPTLALVVPDTCNDMHDCSIATGDAWLRRTLPAILDSPAWAAGNSLLIITFDEDAGTTGNGNRVAALFYGPSVRPHSAFTTRSDHYALLRTLETAWSLPTLTANDAAARSMDGIFRTTSATDTIPPTVPGLPVASTPTGTRVDLAWPSSTDGVGVTRYEVYRDGAWLGSSATASLSDATVLPGMTYTYRVRARDFEGNISAYSALTTVTLPPPPPPTGAIQRTSVATVVNAVATNVVMIPAPAAVASGDLLVACLALNGSGVATGGAPPGWTPIAAVTSIANPKVFGYYHVAGTTEPPSYAWTLSSSVVNGAGIARYTGANTTTPIDVPLTSAAGVAGTTGTLPGVTTVTDGAMLVGCMAINSSSAAVTIGPPVGMGEAWNLAGKRQELADGVQPAAGPSGPKTWTFSSGRDWAGWLVALRAR